MEAKKKSKAVFVCGACGHEAPKWLGRCPGCEAWGTYDTEALIVPSRGRDVGGGPAGLGGSGPVSLAQAMVGGAPRLATGIGELDRVLGGGLVPGGVVLIGGDPGVGKSTLLLQAVDSLGRAGKRALYVTAEESAEQVALRARRLGAGAEGLWLLAETDVERVVAEAERFAPDLCVVDSVQAVHAVEAAGIAGSVGQVREVAARLVALAKSRGIATFLVGHVTKDGGLAGPRALEHLVDAVLYFEGERGSALRVLRATKNRYGSTSEVGIFEMAQGGLREVANPSEALLRERPCGAPGTVVMPCASGARPLLCEVQALVARPQTAMVRRVSPAFDGDRLALLLAVLDQRAGVAVLDRDVFVNVVGGLRIDEPAADLAVVLAVASAARGRVIDAQTIVFGEVGLTGEVRAAAGVAERLREGARMGFRRAILPEASRARFAEEGGTCAMELCGVKDVSAAIEAAV
ncbi:MAG: DNA repair protein RadA [Myxococcota bacterium]